MNTIFEKLKEPSIYGSNVTSIDIIETHISFVILTGRFVYKIKKPVDFGFLDFSTLEKRKYYCEEEIRLNKRLCPDLYLGVVSITEDEKGRLSINGKGRVVEYAVKMKQFPQEAIMTNLLKQDKIRRNDIEKICDILVEFYRKDKPSKDHEKYGRIDSIEHSIIENFEQTKNVIGITISENRYNSIKIAALNFLVKQRKLFEKRKEFIHECHGDLHSGNIILYNDEICIFDCIEFNKHFRFIDTASDIGFLAMDLDFLNHMFLSSYLILSYIEKSEDNSILEVLNFYKSYRAYVRGKVLGFRLSENLEREEREDIIKTASKYFRLSSYYASLLSLDLNGHPPIVFLVSGLTGTGKSTLAMKLAVDYHADILNTDIIRKEIEGIDKFEKHLDKPNTGLYAPDKIDQTYQEMFKRLEEKLKLNKNIILDATFQKKKYRDKVREIVDRYNAIYIAIRCTAPDDIVKKWLEERLREKTVSDGRWEIYKVQKKTFEDFKEDEEHIVVDMSEEDYNERMNYLNKILSKILKESI